VSSIVKQGTSAARRDYLIFLHHDDPLSFDAVRTGVAMLKARSEASFTAGWFG
jgi:hypothetical protein